MKHNTIILIMLTIIVFSLACTITTPLPKVVSTDIDTIPTMPYGAEPEDWRPLMYVNDAKSAGQLDEQKGTK